MISRGRKFRLFVSYFFIFFSIGFYVISNVYHYQISLEQITNQSAINKIKDEINNNYMKINTSNSRTKILDEFPNLSIEDNVYYLESNE